MKHRASRKFVAAESHARLVGTAPGDSHASHVN